MKMLLCTDIQLGAVCTETLDINLSHKWQAARNEKFSDLIDKAARNNAGYIALFGNLFGTERVSESVIDRLFGAVKEDKQIKNLIFLNDKEYRRLSYRNDIPENLYLMSVQKDDQYSDNCLRIRTENNKVKILLNENEELTVSQTAEGEFCLSCLDEKHIIPSFEPVGFDDLNNTYGYEILEWKDQGKFQYTITKDQKYAFQSIEIHILPEDTQNEIIKKINTAVRRIDYDTFLRITLNGRSAFGLTINADALKKHVQGHVFYAEVFDNTVMDIDEEDFENDISLRSEFVRLALQDDSLSESERNRLISAGWNALNGGEVSAE